MDTQRALQEARAAIGAGNYLVAIRQLEALPEKITAQVEEVNQAIDARSARAPRRRR
jgi:hypothetical protein